MTPDEPDEAPPAEGGGGGFVNDGPPNERHERRRRDPPEIHPRSTRDPPEIHPSSIPLPYSVSSQPSIDPEEPVQGSAGQIGTGAGAHVPIWQGHMCQSAGAHARLQSEVEIMGPEEFAWVGA